MVDEMINGLEQKISALLNSYQSVKEEQGNYQQQLAELGGAHHALKERYQDLETRYNALKERYDQAVIGIERMINRLKTVQEEA